MNKLARIFGLHPLVGFGMFAIDWMLFAGEGATLGASLLVSIPVGLLLGIASILIQRHSFRDNWGAAIGKGLIVGTLTAIPTALPSIIPLAGGIIGTLAMLGYKKTDTDEKNDLHLR